MTNKTNNTKKWMIYGANGYSGELIARYAKQQGFSPVLAGRNKQSIDHLATELELEGKVFDLTDANNVAENLQGMDVVIHCAGPFSSTAEPMIKACLKSKTHYLDITGEVAIFEMIKSYDKQAKEAGIVLCPGAGFDVIPTDCLASQLKELMPDATHLALGFDTKSGFSPGTAKTSVEALPKGGRVRKNGGIITVPLAFKTRKIDFGAGEKLAMTIPWGDISTAHFTTNIPNIEVYIPASPNLVKKLRRMNYVRPLLGLGFVQNFLKKRIEKSVRGPSEKAREKLNTYLWGEVTNAKGEVETLRLECSNSYTLTMIGGIKMVEYVLETEQSGYYTPSTLVNNKLLEEIEG
ncbi:MAG: saccharopine dehydrogenase NADP-binding domain-containing protein [Proteobacteria bacterium]|nr:saccharopine dehydrogenase NADP-binding domain-containing protein [Pseudomonadota bacterium]